MESIGKYKLLDQLGTGAVGITYRASDTFRNREMVVKVLNPAITGSPELRGQICRELSAAADLRHPHIVKVRDLGEVGDAIYIATEYLNGVDLRWHIERRILPLGDKIDLMVQLCGALAFAHTKGIPHGNIKPSNIYVTDKDATLLDLGIGKCLAAIVEAGQRPAAVQPNYFAPEQILGKPISARSDVFSVGVVLYELLAKYPFQADVNLVPREIVHSSPEPLRNLDPQIPEELDQLIMRAMEKDPEKRLARIDELAAGLYLISQKPRGPQARRAEIVTGPEPEPVKEAMPLPQPVDLAPPAFAPMVSVPATPPAPPPKPSVLIGPPPPPVQPTAPPALPGSNVSEMPAPGAPVVPPARPAAPKAARPRLWWVPYVAAAILTFVISLAFLSRQSIRASQTKSAAPASVQPASVPAEPPADHAKDVAAPAPQAPAPLTATEVPAEPAATQSEPAAAKPNSAQMLAQVKYLWAAGKYAQALEKVEAILGDDPENLEGRLWKKKIRAAQEAEAAMK